MSEKNIIRRNFNDGVIEYGYYQGNVFIRHREDGPAIIRPDGTEQWMKDGVTHRIDGPAIINKNTHRMQYIVNGIHHREDGPAFILDCGKSKRWYINGQLHREDGPAIESYDKIAYFISSLQVPEKVVMNPKSQSLDEINNEINLEIKRIRIERFGWEEYLQNSDVEIIDSGNNDIEGTKEFLGKINEITIFVGACPSTGRVYVMEVDPSIKSREEARTYLSGKDAKKCVGAT